MPRDAKDVSGALTQKGFLQRNSKDAYYHLYVNGVKTIIWTKISHGEKEIHDGLLGTMARQCRLNKRQFCHLIDCSLDDKGYIACLREQGLVG